MIRALVARDDMRKASTPTLFHPDLHARNIFMSEEVPTQITCIIDWQSCSIEPAWHYSHETPDLYKASPLLEGDLQASEGTGIAVEKLEKDVAVCRKTWEISLYALAPELFAGRAFDQDILRLLHCAPHNWKQGNTDVRRAMLAVSQRWSGDLGMVSECPYQPSQVELDRHDVL